MKSLQSRLTLWFAASIVLVGAALILAAHWHLDYELRQEKWERTHPAYPGWILHGSFTDQEVHDVLRELAQFWIWVAVPIIVLAVFAAWLIARRSTRPVRQINEQLSRLGIRTLAQPVVAPDADPEIGELVDHLNQLLRRLQGSFAQLSEYTGHVAHELRTPLQLMRLRVEANVAALSPELAEELEEELARLSNYVESALTLAHAEQGRLEIALQPVAIRPFLEDVLEPFARLANADGRRLLTSCQGEWVAWTDRDLLKQILFNLLNNALRHGRGDVHVRVRERSSAIVLLVVNAVAGGEPRPGGLGIGLRLVTAIAQQLPGTHLAVRRGGYFAARLRLPLTAQAVGTRPPDAMLGCGRAR